MARLQLQSSELQVHRDEATIRCSGAAVNRVDRTLDNRTLDKEVRYAARTRRVLRRREQRTNGGDAARDAGQRTAGQRAGQGDRRSPRSGRREVARDSLLR